MRWFGRRSTGRPKRRAEPPPDDGRLDELAERLRMMRGNVTTPMEAGAGSTHRSTVDRVEHMSKAARDARFVDRSNEDEVLRNVDTYRSAD